MHYSCYQSCYCLLNPSGCRLYHHRLKNCRPKNQQRHLLRVSLSEIKSELQAQDLPAPYASIWGLWWLDNEEYQCKHNWNQNNKGYNTWYPLGHFCLISVRFREIWKIQMTKHLTATRLISHFGLDPELAVAGLVEFVTRSCCCWRQFILFFPLSWTFPGKTYLVVVLTGFTSLISHDS